MIFPTLANIENELVLLHATFGNLFRQQWPLFHSCAASHKQASGWGLHCTRLSVTEHHPDSKKNVISALDFGSPKTTHSN
jgi:hypothetical protein